jgi:hypothetical protein
MSEKNSPARLHFSNETANTPKDKIRDFLAASYIGTCEALWLLHQWHLFRALPAVTKIRMHDFRSRARLTSFNTGKASQFSLSDQELYFCRPCQNAEVKNMTILEFFENFRLVKFNFADQALLHTDISKIELLRPNLAVSAPLILQQLMKSFKKLRSRRVCRLGIVLPKETEKFMMRKLFLHGPAGSYEELKTDFKQKQHDTFEQCADAEGLLANSNEWEHHMQDAILLNSSPAKLRHLFSLIVSWGAHARPLYDKFTVHMSADLGPGLSDDILRENILRIKLSEMFQQFGLDASEAGLPLPLPGTQRKSELDILKEHFSAQKSFQVLKDKNYSAKEILCRGVRGCYKANRADIFLAGSRWGWENFSYQFHCDHFALRKTMCLVFSHDRYCCD